MIRLHSSLRIRTPEETLNIARQYTSRFHISRVTDTTRLDKIGLPVYAAIRPGARRGSIIVTAGKGLRSIEAKVGALMESIELAFSEPENSSLKIFEKLPSELLQIPDRSFDILDLCPLLGAEIPEDDPLPAILAEDIVSGKHAYIPAELAFIPTEAEWPVYFGYHSNGLASGNIREEAILHGLFELLERDIISFDRIWDSSRFVALESLPGHFAPLIAGTKKANVDLILRTTINSFGMPFFKAYLIDREEINPMYVNVGYGCHCDASIAAVRAITEAIQSRMSFIQGSREDLSEHTAVFEHLNFREKSRIVRDSVSTLSERENSIRFEDIPFPELKSRELPEILSEVLVHLQDHSFIRSVLVASHTEPAEPIQVVKVVVPGLEFYHQDSNRLGRRLHNFIKSITA